MKQRNANIVAWLAIGVATAALLPPLFRHTFPLLAREWEVSHDEAETIALERARDLGAVPDRPYLVTHLDGDSIVDQRLQALPPETRRAVLGNRVGQDALAWEVEIYDLDGPADAPAYTVRVGPNALVTELLRHPPDERGAGRIETTSAIERARAALRREGVDITAYEAPEVTSQQRADRTDLTLRFRAGEQLLGAGIEHGLEVRFAGEEMLGFRPFVDDPERARLEARIQPLILLNQFWVFAPLLLLPLLAIPFVRRYHHGEIGVRRGVQVGAVILVAGAAMLLFVSRAAAAGWDFGALGPRQEVWVVAFQLLAVFFFTLALLAMLSWSVGESMARQGSGWRLAGFDALFQGELANRTFAWSALRGTVGGLVILAATLGLGWGARRVGAEVGSEFFLGPWWMNSDWFSLPLVLYVLAYGLFVAIFVHLLLVTSCTRWLGRWFGAGLAIVLGAALTFPPLIALPLRWTVVIALALTAGYVGLYLRYGLLTSFLAYWVHGVTAGALVFLDARDPGIEIQAWLALLLAAAPVIASVRHLGSDRRFEYHWEDVPPHVRRIAERERQKVELETARGIQSAILPDLPPQIYGVELAHAYLPANEVGGDFYDVLALEDGRLAVAVGDVAGHGVSSGLVMSMAKSALAVQVSFDPEVRAVFTTLNRMVFQSARRRLLTTLCYALLDADRRELRYASAGHLFPFRVGRDGQVRALETSSYPLGVREGYETRERLEQLEPGDAVVLFSDGVVEARTPATEELYGFVRLEESLRRHAGRDAPGLRDGILEDVGRFTGGGPQEDDLTVLVLRLP